MVGGQDEGRRGGGVEEEGEGERCPLMRDRRGEERAANVKTG